MNSADGKVNGNPIGWLQELCMARRWPPPFYETQSEIGLPHERYFTIACHVSTYSETGQLITHFCRLYRVIQIGVLHKTSCPTNTYRTQRVQSLR